LIFAQPLAGPLTLQTSFPLPAPTDRPWQVPLASVPAADALDGEVTLFLTGTNLVEVKTEGLREVPVARRLGGTAGEPEDAAVAWRAYRYGHFLAPGGEGAPRPWLSLSRQARAADPAPEELIDQSRLTTYVEPHGRLLHHFTFRVWNWSRRTLTVCLPGGANPLAVKAYGRWVNPLTRARTEQGTVLDLQVASGVSVHRFEIVYASPWSAPAWALGSRLEATVPALPVRPIAFRRTWRLAPGLVPLAPGKQYRLPGAAEEGFAGLESLLGLEAGREGPLLRQRQLLAQAAVGLREQRPRHGEWRLGEVVNRLVCDYLNGQAVLVLDVEALRGAGLTADTPLPARKKSEQTGKSKSGGPADRGPLWEQWGLVHVTCRAGALLTTERQRQIWKDAAGQSTPPASVEEAVSEAAAYGHDASGRFRTGAEWLQDPALILDPRSSILDPRSSILDPYADWPAWEPVAGLEAAEDLWVVRQRAILFLGVALTLFLVLAAWRLRRLPAAWRLRLLLGLLGASSLALFWLPAALRDLAWWPALAALAGLVIWYLAATVLSQVRGARAGRSVQRFSGSAVRAAGLLLVVGVPSLAGRAAPPAPYTVLLVPDGTAPGKLSALVTPGLLQRLDEMSRRGVAGLPGAVLLSAEYKGRVTAAGSVWDADFQVYCFAKEATLTLPLGDVVLEPRGDPGWPAIFAGKQAFPAALPRGQKGYRLAVRVAEPGQYTLSLRFSAAVAESGGEPTLQLTIPELAQSRFTLDLPWGTRDVLEVSGLGAWQSTDPISGASAVGLGASPPGTGLFSTTAALITGARLKVDLGRVGELRVRWRQPPGQPRRAPPQIQVQETYLWDLRRPDISLSGILYYTIKNGQVPDLTLDLSQGVAVRSVEVRRWPPALGASAPQLLNKSWQVTGTGDNRRLRVQLNGPAAGGLQMIVELVPPLPATPALVSLRLPRPVLPREKERDGDTILQGSLAYRLDGLEAEAKPQHLGVGSIEPQTFARDWRRAVGKFSDAGPPTQAYSFQRLPGGGPAQLGLTLRPPAASARQKLLWRVGPRQAFLEEAAVTLTAPAGNLMLVQWVVPQFFQVTEVTGAQVRSWSQAGARVQVWLKEPCAKTELRLQGWSPLPPGSPNRGPGRWALPCLRLTRTGPQETSIQVAASEGLALKPVRLRNLTPVPAGTPAAPGATLRYNTHQPIYEAAFTVDPAQAAVRVLTRAQVRDRQLVVGAWLDYAVSRGELRTVRVRLRNWYGPDVRVEGPGVVEQVEQRPSQGLHSWILRLRPGTGPFFSVRLTARVPLATAQAFLMPEVTDATGPTVRGDERWLAVAGPEVAVENSRGLEAITDPGRIVRRLSAETRKEVGPIRRAWAIKAGRWRLRLRPRVPAGSPGVRLLLAERTAAIPDGRRWVHQAAYRLYADNAADLRVDVPAGATVLAMALDGRSEVPRQTGPEQFWLALPGAARVQTLRVSWAYRREGEILERPNLTSPRLAVADAEKIPVLLTVRVPPGYQVLKDGMRVEDHPALGNARQDLDRAEGQMRLSDLLRGRSRTQPGAAGELQAAQKLFYWYCRQAEYRLAYAARMIPDFDRKYPRLKDRPRKLREANARRFQNAPALEKMRVQAQRNSSSLVPASQAVAAEKVKPPDIGIPELVLPVSGRPSYWRREASEAPPILRLSPTDEYRTGQAWVATSLILAALLGAWVLSLFPQVLAGLQKVWPEQLILLGWLVWELAGLTGMGLGLMALGAVARLFLFVLWGLGYLHAAQPGAASPGAGAASST
jgi:hypothetical protein